MKEKHCEECSFESEEGLAISGCAYCGCHNKLKLRTISDVKKEFEEEYLRLSIWEPAPNDSQKIMVDEKKIVKLMMSIKPFISQSFRELLEQVVPEESPHQRVSEYYSGFNACRQQIKEIINEILK